MASPEYDDTLRLLSRLHASGIQIPLLREAEMHKLVATYLCAQRHNSLSARLFAATALAEGIERATGIPRDASVRQRINGVIGSWLKERKSAKAPEHQEPRATSASKEHENPPRSPACDAHAFGQIERAAHVLHMLTAGGVDLVRPAEVNQLLKVLASSLARRGPHARPRDYDTAAATLSALEAANLITIDTARRKRATAILGSALAVRR